MADPNTDTPTALSGAAPTSSPLAGAATAAPINVSVPTAAPTPIATEDAAPLTQTIAPQASPTEALRGNHPGFFGRVGQNIVQDYGKPDVPGTVDDAGKYVKAAVTATPGNLFKNLLMGALSGMSNFDAAPKGSGMAGGIAAGLAGGIEHNKDVDATNRQHAQQDFANKNAATSAANQALLVKANIAHINLQAEGQAQVNEQNKTLFPLEVQEKIATIAGTDAEHEKTMRAMGYTPAPIQADGSNAVNNYSDATPQNLKDMAAGKLDITPSNSPSSPAAVHAWIAPPDDARIPQDITVRQWKLDPKTNLPVVDNSIPAYTLKAGEATAGQARLATANEYNQRQQLVKDYLSQQDTRSQIQEHLASANKSNASANKSNADAAVNRAAVAQMNNVAAGGDSAIVDGMINGTLDVTKIASLRPGKAGDSERLRLFKLAEAKDPTFNQAEYQKRLGVQTSFAYGKDSEQVKSFNTFIQHADDLSQGVDALRNTSSPLINRPYNWLRQNAGKPDVAQFMAQMEPVRKEFMTFLNNNHALTESDKVEGQKLLDENQSPAQSQVAIKQFMHTALARLNTTNDKFANTMHSDYPDLLDVQSRNALNRAAGGTDPASIGLRKVLTSNPAFSGLPPQAMQQLQEGHVTAFANGQQWTIQNGLTVRVK